MIRAVFAGLFAILVGAPALAAIEIKEVTSPGGIRAWLVEEHGIPFTALEIRFQGGASLDAPGKRGAINLMTATLEEGAGDLDARGFAEAREALAAEFGFDVHDDAMSVSARFLSENKDASVALLKKGLMETRFDQDAIDRVKGQIASIIQSDLKDPERIAGRTFDAMAYGDHPYATSLNGTAESLAALTRDDIIAAKAAVMARDRMFVSAVGDITPDQLGALLDDLLGGLPATGAPMPPRAAFGLTGGLSVIDYGSPQSVVTFGHAGISRDDPDFFAAFVLNQILGGSGFTARLMEEVREKRGLTYGIGTYLVTTDLADTWQGGFSSANEKVAEAIKVIRAEWARAAADGVTEKELADAKTYLTGSYPLRFDGNGPIADILVGMQMQGLPISYLTNRNGYIEAVTLDDVKRVAAKWMKPDALRFVVVGKPVGLTATD
jgi:zinc protease